MSLIEVNFKSEITRLESFGKIAAQLSNEIILKINSACYRIVDFEFYTFANGHHDPHTYKNKQQLQNGKLYLHGSGIDITLGDGTNYCGLLVRSIVKLSETSGKEAGFMGKQFNGPQVVATELFSNLNSIYGDDPNEIKLVEFKNQNIVSVLYPSSKTLTSKRIGLTSKQKDTEGLFQNLRYRYILILSKYDKFKQTTKGIEHILSENIRPGGLTETEADEIRGYKKRSK